MSLFKAVIRQFVLWGAILCILISACGESGTRSIDPGEQKYRDFSDAEDMFLESIIVRDKDQLFEITSEAAFEEISGWLNRPSIDCSYKKGDYRMSASGGSRISEIQTSDFAIRDKIRVQISCDQQDSNLLVLYNLEVEKLEFVYTADGWKIDSWESIREHKGF